MLRRAGGGTGRVSPMRGLHRGWFALGLAVLAVLLLVGLDDALVQVRLANAQATLGDSSATAIRQVGFLHDLGADLALAAAGDTAVAKLVTQSNDTVAHDQGTFNQSQAGIAAQNTTIDWFNTCLGGARAALGALGARNASGAVQALGSVSVPCEQLIGAGGPVYPFDFADPFVLRVGGTYYAYGTNATTGNVQVIESTDLSRWSTLPDALPALPRWARANSTWAPAVLPVAGGYRLYYTVSDAAGGGVECISVATSPSPQGPYTDDSAGPLECQPSAGGSIDPSPYTDASGNLYLTWRSIGGTPTIWAQAMNPTGTALSGNPVPLVTPSYAWEGGVVEAPTMVLTGGRYTLLYSANDWRTAAYAVGLATCQGPLGPCSKQSSPVLASQGPYAGPGGEAVFTDTQGNLWIAFHGWIPGAVGYPNPRLLFLRPFQLGASGAVVGG
jgi:Glycosyl hydrolases family 43